MPARKLPTLGDELANLKARVMALEAREPGAWARDATPLEQLRQTYLGNTGLGIGSLGPYGVEIGCRAYHSVDQAIPSGAWTKLALDRERKDNDHIHDLVTNNSRLTAQTPGWYSISGHARFENSGLGTLRGLMIRLNGVMNIAIDVRDVEIGVLGPYSLWIPEAPPKSPSAYDDEFNDSLFDNVLWTEFDPDGIQTIYETPIGLILEQTAHAGNAITGIYQAIPAGDFAIATKLSLSTKAYVNEAIASIALWEDATDAAKRLYVLSLASEATAPHLQLSLWGNYTTWTSHSLDKALDYGGHTDLYLRLRRSDGTYYADYSTDGVGWMQIWTGALLYAPAHMGLVFNQANTDMTGRAYFEFFRHIIDPAFTQILQGDRLLVGGGVASQQAHTFGLATVYYMAGAYPYYVELLAYQDTGGPLNLESGYGWSVEFAMALMRV